MVELNVQIDHVHLRKTGSRCQCWVVAGSMNEATRRQADNALCRERTEVVDIDAARMVSDCAEQEIASVVEQACARLS
ncbi:Inner membrane protein [Salmonella bongori]|nr:Inner membrane protein [Salmonella bongori]